MGDRLCVVCSLDDCPGGVATIPVARSAAPHQEEWPQSLSREVPPHTGLLLNPTASRTLSN
jgi:hypothetical protein